ncbi:unnamed protein product [Lepidochelys kempii]
MQSLCVWLFPFFAGLCHAELTRELSREAERLGLSSALGLSWNMALQVSALALLLALPPLLSAQGAGLPSSSRPKTPEKCPRPQWDPRLRFVPDRPFYGQNEQTTLSCPGGSQPSPSVIRCVRQGQTWSDWARWDRGTLRPTTGNVTCPGMCNDWVRQVDFDPAQTEFGVGAEGRVTCRQQFQQNSFNVTCRETASGLFEWELGAHKCLREAQAPQRGGRAVAVAVPVVLVLLAAGALLLWFLLSRKRQASASCPAKDTGEALYTVRSGRVLGQPEGPAPQLRSQTGLSASQ